MAFMSFISMYRKTSKQSAVQCIALSSLFFFVHMCEICETNSTRHAVFSGTVSIWLFISSTGMNHMVTQWSAVITQFENGVAIGSYGFFLVGFSLAQSPTIGPCWTGMGNFTAVIGIAVNKTTMQRIIFPMWCVSYGLSTASHHTKY